MKERGRGLVRYALCLGISGMHVNAWLTQIVRISAYRCEQVVVTCEPMHIRGAFKEPVASSLIFPSSSV